VKNVDILKYNAMKEMRQKKLIENEYNYGEELISALDELREEKNSLKERIDETKGKCSHF
jgi:hypothetical protein